MNDRWSVIFAGVVIGHLYVAEDGFLRYRKHDVVWRKRVKFSVPGSIRKYAERCRPDFSRLMNYAGQ